MSLEFKKIGTGHLYAFRNGEIKEYYGEILHRNKYIDDGYVYDDRTQFAILDSKNKVVRKLQCSSIEGEIYNRAVWFYKPNKKIAAKKFIEYERQEIDKLKEKYIVMKMRLKY